MKKMFIVSSLLAMFFANSAVLAEGMQDDQSMNGTNLSSNNAPNPFGSSALDGASAPQPDTAGTTADDSDSW